MFIHIVLWKLKETAGGRSRDANARLLKERFEELANMLDGVRRLDVGINAIPGADAADVALYAEFESRGDYEAYYAHPAHKALVAFIQDVRDERRVIDYESGGARRGHGPRDSSLCAPLPLRSRGRLHKRVPTR
jgi:hypothetical protein